jgi:hypothetical protein
MAAVRAYDTLAASDELASDLALVAAADSELGMPSLPRTEIVSPLEGGANIGPLTAPAPKRKPGPGPAAPVEVKVKIAEVETPTPVVVMTTVSASPEPVAAEAPAVSDLPPLPRPRPMEPRFPVGDGSVWGTHGNGGGGMDPGDGAGTRPGDVGGPLPGEDGTPERVDGAPEPGRRRGTVVIRGGSDGVDHCIPRSTGGIPRIGSIGVLINQRGPAGQTTFPTFPRR